MLSADGLFPLAKHFCNRAFQPVDDLLEGIHGDILLTDSSRCNVESEMPSLRAYWARVSSPRFPRKYFPSCFLSR